MTPARLTPGPISQSVTVKDLKRGTPTGYIKNLSCESLDSILDNAMFINIHVFDFTSLSALVISSCKTAAQENQQLV